MSTLILMKILESSPSRYDRGIKLLMGNKIYTAFDKIASIAKENDLILDIGCGTGILPIMLANNGAVVKGIDINPDMLEIAQKRISEQNLIDLVSFQEKGIAEIDSEPDETYDMVTSTLCFSELELYEINFALRHIHRILKSQGLFILVDEIKPKNPIKRILSSIIRFPLVIITYILTQNTTKALKNIEINIKDAGFKIKEVKTNRFETFIEMVCEKR